MPSLANEVTCERLDGSRSAGMMSACDTDGITIAASGGPLTIPWTELSKVSFGESGPLTQLPEQVMIFLRGGGRITGTLAQSAGEEILIRHAYLGALTLKFSDLDAVRLVPEADQPAAATAFEKAFEARQAGADQMVTRDSEQARTVMGTLLTLGPERGSFSFAGRDREFAAAKVFGFVMAVGTAGRITAPVRVELLDGTVLPATRIACSAEPAMEVHLISGQMLTVPMDRLAAIFPGSDRIAYLSDMTAVEVKSEGRIHAPTPMARDQSVAAAPISLGGTKYARGLGMHSRCEATYALDGKYAAFAATIGIDDIVRPAGSVVFKVIGDGRVLFDSGVVSGTDAPREITCDVAGVGALTLIADFGPGLDLADYADWADARLIKAGD